MATPVPETPLLDAVPELPDVLVPLLPLPLLVLVPLELAVPLDVPPPVLPLLVDVPELLVDAPPSSPDPLDEELLRHPPAVPRTVNAARERPTGMLWLTGAPRCCISTPPRAPRLKKRRAMCA